MSGQELLLDEKWSELELSADTIVRTANRFAPFALGLIIAAFLIGLGVSSAFRANVVRIGLGSDVTLDMPDLPIVEPLVLRQIDKVAAKKINDATPLTEVTVPAAAPFLFFGKPDDMMRATDCLAATIYYEAGAEAVAGQMAVAQVVLNRVRHPAYPKTVCGVVFQGHERRTGCQFSYTCDGSMIRRRPGGAAWTGARSLARAMLSGVVYSPVGLATHYHTDWVLPAWSARLDKVRVERSHLFFRYQGYWGTPKAFRGRYAGVEAPFGKLGLLSPAHRTSETDALAVLPAVTDKPTDIMATATLFAPERVSQTVTTDDRRKDTFMIYVDPLLEPEALSALADRACGVRTRCKVLAWADQDLMPKGMVMDDAARAGMAFSYVRTGSMRGRQIWNCALFPRSKASECLPVSR
jgi:hypothetical protein